MITGMNIQAGAKIAPAFMLKQDNEDITQDFSDRLISLTMTTIADSRPTSSISSSMTPTGKSLCLRAAQR